jgi:pimeloyl-ACP methyl ester carboxylesterase
VSPPTPPKQGFRHGATPPRGADAERLLTVSTGILLDARERNEALAALDLERQIANLDHEWAPYRGKAIHLERHGDDPQAPTVVVAHGLGDHARRQLGLAAALSELGFNALLVDRLGHGISEGRRGDATLESDLGVLELAIALARSRSSGPVILLGDSLGGIMSWYLLTREPDVEAVVCHCIGHPDEYPDRATARKAPLMRMVGRLAPYAPVPVSQIADYDHVAIDPQTKRYFDEQLDGLFNFRVSARSLASYIGFRPGIGWEAVTTPVLVLIGAEDRMVTPEFTRRSLERARPPHATYAEVPDAGHQLFLDHLGSAFGPLAEWLQASLERDGDGSVAVG